jgi:hypothetical protein
MKSVIALSSVVIVSILLVVACSGDTPAPVDSRTATFDVWLTKARSVFANSGADLKSIVYDFHCQNQIGDEASTEPACAGFQFLLVGEEQITINADWSTGNLERWHADMSLDSPLKVNCNEIQSSVEYKRAKNAFAELVACRTQAGDEVLLMYSPSKVTIAFLSKEFLWAYPGYVTHVFQSVESSP